MKHSGLGENIRELTVGARRPPKMIIPEMREKQVAQYNLRFAEVCMKYAYQLSYDESLDGKQLTQFS